ncbi:hypothetical protein SynRS9909_02384 [Synechococcus sp. RS9909]|nr:hypothetical protein SynRS9909_02384 [Synechococcus sp. RS9909]
MSDWPARSEHPDWGLFSIDPWPDAPRGIVPTPAWLEWPASP